MDHNRAYLIGKNVHFIYKHGIYMNFVSNEETVLFEFVDKGLVDFILFDSIFEPFVGKNQIFGTPL